MTEQVAPLLVVIALVAVASLSYRRANGAVRPTDVTFTPDELRELGIDGGRRSLLLFTAPGCAPCAVAKRLLDDLGSRTQTPVVVADVTDHAAIAAAQHVYRAPTVFVVDERGHAVARVAGVPREGELDELVAAPRRAAA